MISLTMLLTLSAVQAQESDYYTVDYLTPPEGEVLEVGGMDFMSDGRLVVSTRRGQVWMVENPLAENPADAKFSLFCEGLWEGLGVRVVDDEIFIVQRGELSRLRDTDGDGTCDHIDSICNSWGVSGNYHEFAYGLPVDERGHFFVALNVSFFNPKWWHGKSPVPYRGWVLDIAPDGTITPVASGLRSPCGMGFNSVGDLFITDNQGDWMPASPVFHIQQDKFYGHPASLDWTKEYRETQTLTSDTVPPARAAADRAPAALWLPYKWSRSPGNLVPDTTSGRFGPFKDQLFISELTNGMVLRADLEKVRGQYQGAVFLFRQEIGSCVRVTFAGDGTLFCGMTNRGWGGLPPADGIARMRWTGKTPMEMQSVHLLQDGFEIEFTRPVAENCTITSKNVALSQYDYDYWWEYGSPERDTQDLVVTSATLDASRRKLTVRAENLEAARVARLLLYDVVDELGSPLLHNEFAYTINQLPEGEPTTKHVAKIVPPPPTQENKDEGWLRLTYGDATGLWEFEGWELCDAAADPENPTRFVTKPGNGALANTAGEKASDYTSRPVFGDASYRMSFMLPKDGESALVIQGRYELRLSDSAIAQELTPDHCGGITGMAAPTAHPYGGFGKWHELELEFLAPRFDAKGAKVENARIVSAAIDGVQIHKDLELTAATNGLPEVAHGPLVIRGTGSHFAIGDVRAKSNVLSTERDANEWTPIFNGDDLEGWLVSDDGAWEVEYDAILGGGERSHLFSPRGDYKDFELHAEMKIGDGGNSGLYFRVAYGGGWPEGYEAQVNSSYPDPQKTGSLYSFAPIGVSLVGPDTWFDYRVRCVDEETGTHITIWVNDIVITDFVDTKRTHAAGHIALQQHHQGSVIEVRKLEIREF